MPTFTQDFPEFRNMDSGHESLDRIRRSYATKDAERARAARRRMQEGARRGVEPQNDGQMREWEARRQARAARQRERGGGGNRELIDGRGSIDSRAFNERREIVGYTIDERDRHDPMVDAPESASRWRSQDGYSVSRQRISSGRTRTQRPTQIGLQGGSLGKKRDFAAANRGSSGIPLFVKVAIPVIIVLVVILIFLLTP